MLPLPATKERGEGDAVATVERPPASDPACEGAHWQPERKGRVRCGAGLATSS